MARRYYSSTAARTTLASGVDDTTNTFTVNAVSGWPTSTPYTLIIDQDTVNEEIVEVTGRTGTTITVTRGVDGTSAVAHSSGAAVNHGVSARDFDEPNAFLNSGTWQLIDAKGDLVVGTASDTADRLAVGSNGYVLRADSTEATGLEWYDIATDLGLKFDKRPDQNLQTGSSYTFATSDDAKLITASAAASAVYTVPPQSSASWADDTVLRVINLGAGEVSFAGGSGVTVNNSAAKIAQYEGATVVRTGSDSWTVVPFGGAGGEISPAVISSPAATGSYTDGDTYDYYTFTASGTLTVDTAGFADVLVVGGGAGGGGFNGGGGGAGAYVEESNIYLAAGTATVTVGAGGAGVVPTTSQGAQGGSGGTSSIDIAYAVGGGGGGAAGTGGGVAALRPGVAGGSGGGHCGNGISVGSGGSSLALGSYLGNNGGSNATTASPFPSGGGAGANAVGADGASSQSGAGGNGESSSITGSSVTYGGGGGGGSSTQGSAAGAGGSGGGGSGATASVNAVAGTANTGGGGGGGRNVVSALGGGANGGSGVVIVRVRV